MSVGADSFNVTSIGRNRRSLPHGAARDAANRTHAGVRVQRCRTRTGLRHFCMERRVARAPLTDSADGANSQGWITGPARPGVVGNTVRQLEKEFTHGNEAQEGCEKARQESEEEEEGCKTQSSSKEETREEEKGGPKGRQEKSCEETRQEESQEADDGDQACGETCGARAGGGSCCSVDGGCAWGKDCP